jgi:transcriptional regulator with XRE-family HTH domain
MYLGKNIRFLRKQKNLSREQLAGIIKVNPRMITTYETGKSEPRIEKLLALSDTFKVLIDDLIRKDLSDN